MYFPSPFIGQKICINPILSFPIAFVFRMFSEIKEDLTVVFQIESRRKKMSSLEKDRQDLQSTIDALQEGSLTLFLVHFGNSYCYIY